jgi:hypothetical protein
MNDYLPCFQNVGDDWRQRWTILRQFIRNWFWKYENEKFIPRELHGVEQWDQRIDVVEQRLNVKLPPSLKEWVSLFEQTDSEYFNLLRDDYAMLWSDSDQTLVICVLCEGNIAWGVKKEHLNLPDPPVQEMDIVSYGEDNSWRGSEWKCRKEIRPTVTEFLVKQILHYAPSETYVNISLPKEVEPRRAMYSEMDEYFDRCSTFGMYKIYESKNMFAGVTQDTGHFTVKFRKEVDYDRLPNWLRKNTRDYRFR